MATITTALAPLPTPVAYIGPAPSQELWQTPIPRGEIDFIEQTAAVTISGAGDNQLLQIQCGIPRGFGYVLMDAYMTMQNIDVDAWSAATRFRILDSAATPTWRVNQRFEAGSVINTGTLFFHRTWQLVAPAWQKVIICDKGDDGQLLVQVMNLTLDQAAGSVDFLARFLQFDLNQAYRWSVNTPFPVR